MRQRTTSESEQLQHVVDRRRIALLLATNREQAGQSLAESRRRHDAFADTHPVEIAAQRIDLAVVTEEPVWMRQPPRREGVGRESRMHQRDGADEIVLAEILVERR